MKGESLLTRLVFENALRIRLRGESADKDKDGEKNAKRKSDVEATANDTTAPLPLIAASVDNEALVETVMDPRIPSESTLDNHLLEASAATTAVDTSDVASQAGSSKAPADGEDQKSKTVPIIGKINTLLTSDMEKVISAQEGLALRESKAYSPLRF